jgi:deoxyhypusine synthase
MDLLRLLVRAGLIGFTCYLISQGNLTAAAVIIGLYWIMLELIQAQLVKVMVITGASLKYLYNWSKRDLN